VTNLGSGTETIRRQQTATGSEDKLPPAWRDALLELPLCIPLSTWAGHIPFMFLAFSLAKPRVFVELGVDLGASFVAACEAADRFHVNTRCFGIDTWQGDDHARYSDGEAVFPALRTFIATRYPACSLLRLTFDEANTQFRDKSIDLLHIDGLHTYEAVAHDFETWLPKLSEQSIVLFHDTEVRTQNFGVHRFWSEIIARYRHFQFTHSSGLGVLVTGSSPPSELAALIDFAAADQSGVLEALCQAAANSMERRMADRGPLMIKERTLMDRLVLHRQMAPIAQEAKPRRNELCHCGSGLRYKHCHGKIA
jgi:hypothetical protein